jgi:hypothetical protein
VRWQARASPARDTALAISIRVPEFNAGTVLGGPFQGLPAPAKLFPRFFELAKALLHEPPLIVLLSDAKGDALDGRQATKTPTARLISRVRETAAAPVQRISPPRA